MKDYSYQEELIKDCFEALPKYETVVLAAAPGAGKTNMAIRIAQRYYEKYGNKVLILAHGQNIIKYQWEDRMTRLKIKLPFSVIESKKKNNFNSAITIAIPQTLRSVPNTFKPSLVIIDEAHQRFEADEVQNLIKKVGANHVLCLTGTPAIFMNRKNTKVIGVTLEELIDKGICVFPLTEICISTYGHRLEDMNALDNMKISAKFKKKDTKLTLDLVLNEIMSRLVTSIRPTKWDSSVKNWNRAFTKLDKTMIVCYNQKQAKDVYDYFQDKHVNVQLSISDFNDGKEEVREFKENNQCKVFIVVGRGILGFDYEELFNIIDMSFTLNTNRLFQLICRLDRLSKSQPKRIKFYLKLTTQRLYPLTHLTMAYSVAMCFSDYYYSGEHYPVKSNHIPITQQFKRFVDFLNKEDFKNKNIPLPSLPLLPSFEELKQNRMGLINTLAYTDFNTLRKKLYVNKSMIWSLPEAITIMNKYTNRKDFSRKDSGCYTFMYNNYRDVLDAKFPRKHELWSLDRSLIYLNKYPIASLFKQKCIGGYRFMKRNHPDILKKYPPTLMAHERMKNTEEVLKLYNQGNSLIAISEKLNMSLHTLRKITQDSKLKPRHGRIPFTKTNPMLIEEVLSLREKKHSYRQIGKITSASHGTIGRILKEHKKGLHSD